MKLVMPLFKYKRQKLTLNTVHMLHFHTIILFCVSGKNLFKNSQQVLKFYYIVIIVSCFFFLLFISSTYLFCELNWAQQQVYFCMHELNKNRLQLLLNMPTVGTSVHGVAQTKIYSDVCLSATVKIFKNNYQFNFKYDFVSKVMK